MGLFAWISRLSGPTRGGPLSFSPSLIGRVLMVPYLISSPKGLQVNIYPRNPNFPYSGEVAACSALLRIIG
jgi:hypothetical protein